MRSILRILLVVAIWGASTACADTIYVRTSGDDAQSGTTPQQAVRTLGYAATLARAGDRIVVAPGVYHEGNISPAVFGHISFIADRRGTRIGEPPGDVVIEASGFSSGFELNHTVAATIDGFVIYGAVNAIYVKSQSDQVVVSNNVVCGNSGNGIYVQDSKNVTVFNNLVYANEMTGILITGNVSGSSGARIINNTVYQNGNRGIFFGGTTIGSPGGLVINNISAENATAGVQVNATSQDGYLSGGNVVADRFASGTPMDPTDVRADPVFVSNPAGADGQLGGPAFADDDFHLSQRRAGQPITSPAVDAGSDFARRLKLNRATTRTDSRPDGGFVDAGYHYRNFGPLPLRPGLRLRTAALYVDALHGSDANDGRSRTTPMQTLSRALVIAQPGNRVLLQRGTYREGEVRFPTSGKPGRPVILEGLPGAVIDGTGSTRVVLISGQSYITLVGLDVSGADDGIEIRTGASNVSLVRCHVHHNGRRGLHIADASNISVQASVIEENASRGIQVDGSDSDVLRTTIRHNGDEGLWATAASTVSIVDSVLVGNGKSGLLVDGSTLNAADTTINSSQDGGARFRDGSIGTLTNVSVVDNVGVGIQGLSSSVQIIGGIVARNTVVGVQAIVDTATLRSNEMSISGTRVCNNPALGISAQDSALSLADATICSNGDDGLRVTNGTLDVTRTTVDGNKGRGINGVGMSRATLATVGVANNGKDGLQLLSATFATLSDCELSSNNGNGLSVQLTDATISECTMQKNRASGISAQAATLTLTDTRLMNNTFDGLRQSGGSADLVRTTAELNGGKGITISFAGHVVVSNSTVRQNADNGLQVMGADNPTITGTAVLSNTGDGMTVLDSAVAEITNNLIYANGSTGITIAGDTSGSPNAEVLNNTIYGNGNRGLVVGGSNAKPPSGGARVLRNIFQGNATAGVQVNALSLPGYVGDYNLNMDRYAALTPIGIHDILADPLLVRPAGADGVLGGTGAADDNFHLSQRAAGQAANSPAVDAGGMDVLSAGMVGTTTRTDSVPDTGMVDLGFHYLP